MCKFVVWLTSSCFEGVIQPLTDLLRRLKAVWKKVLTKKIIFACSSLKCDMAMFEEIECSKKQFTSVHINFRFLRDLL